MKFSEFFQRYDLPFSTDAVLHFLYSDKHEDNLFKDADQLHQKGYTDSATISGEVYDMASSYVFDLEFEILACLDSDEREIRKKEDLVKLLRPLEEMVNKALKVEDEEE